MLDDLGLGEDNNTFEASKKDSTVFIIDCSVDIMHPFADEEKSQLQVILESYSNFLQRRILGNNNDKVGLILYNVKQMKNSINHPYIFKVHNLEDAIDAKRIKEAGSLYKDFYKLF